MINETNNPQKLPLNKLFIEVIDGIHKKIPALDSYWIETSRPHIKYEPLPVKNGELSVDNGILDEWVTEMTWFNKELEWLLKLPTNIFWSNFLFDTQFSDTVASFLQESTPGYIPLISLTSDIKILELYSEIFKNILTIICRLITNKENDYEWMEKSYLAEVLYSNYIISIPMIFDLITTYGRSNGSLLKRIIETIIKIEPKYQNDLEQGLNYVKLPLKKIMEEIQFETPIGLLEDFALHALDCAYTLNVMLDVCSVAREICSKIGLERNLSDFYENAIPKLFERIYFMSKSSIGLVHVKQLRVEILGAYHSILSLQLDKALENPLQSLAPAEMFLNSLTEVMSDRIFLYDYNHFHPVQSNMDILKEICPEIDSFKIDFVLKGLAMENGHDQFEEDPKNMYEETLDLSDIIEGPSSSKPLTNGAACNTDSVEENVQRVRDVLPHLGDGFIRKILLRYENVEQTIAAVLECNLPPDLAESDQTEVYIPPDTSDEIYLDAGIKRLNIYDGDDYDVMTQDKLKGVVKRGKGLPGQPKDLKTLLDDKSHVQEFKSRYQEYTMVSDDVDAYDDEYDDSYEAMAESETKAVNRRTSAAKNVIVDEIDDESEESDEDAETGNPKSGTNFCENPEAIRARYQQKRQSMMSKQHGPPRVQHSVVGNAKGQGQDEKTQHARQAKDVHKSSRANHNRKRGAQFKQSRGMF